MIIRGLFLVCYFFNFWSARLVSRETSIPEFLVTLFAIMSFRSQGKAGACREIQSTRKLENAKSCSGQIGLVEGTARIEREELETDVYFCRCSRMVKRLLLSLFKI